VARKASRQAEEDVEEEDSTEVALLAAEAEAEAEAAREADEDAKAAARAEVLDAALEAAICGNTTCDSDALGDEVPADDEIQLVAVDGEQTQSSQADSDASLHDASQEERSESSRGALAAAAEQREAERLAWRLAARQKRAARAEQTAEAAMLAAATEQGTGAEREAVLSSQAQRETGGEGVPSAPLPMASDVGKFMGPTKELRRDGFALAEKRYLDCLPELREFEALAAAAAEEAAAGQRSDNMTKTRQGKGGEQPSRRKGRH
jgi:hypothetical protein